MPRSKGIGGKFKPKRDASAPDLRPKGKQKLETAGRAEEPCNVDSDDEEFFFVFIYLLLLFFGASTNQCQDRALSMALGQCGGRPPGGSSSPIFLNP